MIRYSGHYLFKKRNSNIGMVGQTNEWDQLKQNYPRHYAAFHAMIRRCSNEGISCDFTPVTPQTFRQFIEAIGPVPNGMKKPVRGRYDHILGYVFDKKNNRWNFRWQESSENSRQQGKTWDYWADR